MSCGIAVIGMRRAMKAPMPPPMAMPTMMRMIPVKPGRARNSVVTTAMTMPAMPR